MSSRKLSAIIRDEISALINVEFMKGSKIPTEEELCARFDVSRTTLREAIKELCSLNILEIRRGVGTFVKETPGIVDDPFGFRFQDPDKFATDMWEASFLVEPELAYLGALRRTDETVENLKRIHKEFTKVSSEYKASPSEKLYKKLFELDGEFHMGIAKACGNVVLEGFYRSYIQMVNSNITPDNAIKTLESNEKYHPLLINDIEKRYADNAKLNLIYHNSEVKRIWEESHK